MINKEIGEVKSAKVLRNGTLMVFCKDGGQNRRAIRMDKLNGNAMLTASLGEFLQGSQKMSVDAFKANITNAKIKKVKCIKTNRDRFKWDSLSILITFEENTLPEKLHVGYMFYNVRLNITPALRCFKCQRFGHVAAACKEKPTCGMYSGEHEYRKCEKGVKLK